MLKDSFLCEMVGVDLSFASAELSERSVGLGNSSSTPSLGTRAARDESEAANNSTNDFEENTGAWACPGHT